MANEHLLELQGESTTASFTLNWSDFVQGDQSDNIPAGNYKFAVRAASVFKKKDGEAVFLKAILDITEPKDGPQGKLVVVHPLSIGNLKDKDVNKKSYYARTLVAALVSPERVNEWRTEGERMLTPEALIGKEGHVSVIRALRENGQEESRVDKYITEADFAAAPGPAKNAPAPTSVRPSTAVATPTVNQSTVSAAVLDAPRNGASNNSMAKSTL